MSSEKDNLNGGAFLIARKLFQSDFWLTKPSSWKVIFIYILGHVNYADHGKLQRGQGFFNFNACKREIGIDITPDNIKKFLHSARHSHMLSTTRSTRGTLVTVLNFDKYQKLLNFRAPREAPQEAREKHSDTKERKKEITISSAEEGGEIKIPNLLEADRFDIRIIGLFAQFKGIFFDSREKQRAFIRRNVRAARELMAYSEDEIKAKMSDLAANARFKWTLETVGKYIDEQGSISFAPPGSRDAEREEIRRILGPFADQYNK